MGEIAASYVSIVPKISDNFGAQLQSQMKRSSAGAFGPIDAEGKKAGAKSGKTFGSAFQGVVGPLIKLASVGAAAAYVKSAVDSFAQLEDATAAASVVFGNSMDVIQKQADGAAQSIFMSKREAIDAAITFGTFGKSAGLAGSDLAGFSTQMVQLAGDMASFRGTSTEESITAIGAAMRGENESIARYGVLLNDANLRSRALKLGLISTTKDALSPQNKVLAAQAEILAQTTDAQGDAARTANSTANVQKRLTKETENFNAAMGAKLAPTIVEVQQGLSNLMGTAEENNAVLGPLTDTAKGLATAFNDVTKAMNGGTEAGKALKPFLDQVNMITGVKWVQELANAYVGWSGGADAATTAVKANTAAEEEGTGALKTNSEALQENIDKLNAQYTALLKARGDQRSLEAAIDDGAKSIKDYRDGLVKKYVAEGKSKEAAEKMAEANIKSGKALDITTAAGRKNQEALDGIADRGKAAGGNMNTARAAFIKTAEKMGLSAKAAKDLATKLGLIKSPKPVKVNVEWGSKPAPLIIQSTKTRMKIGYAGGGAIHGYGTGTSDDVPAMLSNGEHVLTAAEVRAMGGQQAVYRMRAMARSGRARFAAGGSVGAAAAGVGLTKADMVDALSSVTLRLGGASAFSDSLWARFELGKEMA